MVAALELALLSSRRTRARTDVLERSTDVTTASFIVPIDDPGARIRAATPPARLAAADDVRHARVSIPRLGALHPSFLPPRAPSSVAPRATLTLARTVRPRAFPSLRRRARSNQIESNPNQIQNARARFLFSSFLRSSRSTASLSLDVSSRAR